MSFFKQLVTPRNNGYQSSQGFTLIELLVCISIISIVSAVILVRNNSFNGAVLLRNQSYELAFAVRQAQLLAVSGSDPTVRQYGVFINTANASTRRLYVVFRDANNNNRYELGEEVGNWGKLDSRFEIRQAYAGTTLLAEMTIMFRRPNFDGLFYRGSGVLVSGPAFIDVAQVGQSGNGSGVVRRVEVTSSGQVSVTTYP